VIVYDTAVTTSVLCSLRHDASDFGFGGPEPCSPSQDVTLLCDKGWILEGKFHVNAFSRSRVATCGYTNGSTGIVKILGSVLQLYIANALEIEARSTRRYNKHSVFKKKRTEEQLMVQ
jgi:hypothetical protein